MLHTFVSNSLWLKIFYWEIQYHLEKLACKFLRVTTYIYFDEGQTPSLQDQKTQDGRLRAYMEYFNKFQTTSETITMSSKNVITPYNELINRESGI